MSFVNYHFHFVFVRQTVGGKNRHCFTSQWLYFRENVLFGKNTDVSCKALQHRKWTERTSCVSACVHLTSFLARCIIYKPRLEIMKRRFWLNDICYKWGKTRKVYYNERCIGICCSIFWKGMDFKWLLEWRERRGEANGFCRAAHKLFIWYDKY